jgi:hypothetical protein
MQHGTTFFIVCRTLDPILGVAFDPSSQLLASKTYSPIRGGFPI